MASSPRSRVVLVSGSSDRVAKTIAQPSSRCTSFNFAGMSISWVQDGRQSPQPAQDVPFLVKAAYSFRARSSS